MEEDVIVKDDNSELRDSNDDKGLQQLTMRNVYRPVEVTMMVLGIYTKFDLRRQIETSHPTMVSKSAHEVKRHSKNSLASKLHLMYCCFVCLLILANTARYMLVFTGNTAINGSLMAKLTFATYAVSTTYMSFTFLFYVSRKLPQFINEFCKYHKQFGSNIHLSRSRTRMVIMHLVHHVIDRRNLIGSCPGHYETLLPGWAGTIAKATGALGTSCV
jgi:hypothetical protein